MSHLIPVTIMDQANQHQLLLRIVAGSAWVDGHLEEEEVKYLERLLERYDLMDNTELKSLLQEPISARQTESWMVEYLRDATEDERMQLLGAIGNLLIADDRVSPEEHELLDDYHTLMSNIPPRIEAAPKLVSAVGQFFKKVVQAVKP